jgi:nucleoside-diphosphate-sugar epimerase
MKVLVLGASGFVGRNFILSAPSDWDITAIYRNDQTFPEFVGKKAPGIRVLRADLAADGGGEMISQTAKRFDCCIHLAGNGDPARSVETPRDDLLSHAGTLVGLLEKVRVEKFIYFSSGAVYDGMKGDVTPATPVNPKFPYAIAKHAAEQYLGFFCRHGRVGEGIVVRFFGAYGPYEPDRKVYTRLVRRFGIERDPRFTIQGDGRNYVDAMYVDDAVRAILLLIKSPVGDRTIDLYSGEPLTLNELVLRAARLFDLDAEIVHEGEVPEYIEFRAADRYMFDDLRFRPQVPLEDGLRRLHQQIISAEALR